MFSLTMTAYKRREASIKENVHKTFATINQEEWDKVEESENML